MPHARPKRLDQQGSIPMSAEDSTTNESATPQPEQPLTQPPLRGAVRLEDIAARVGVSRSEVSRVLNNRLRAGRSVGRAKQEEIWRVAREMNYQPHRAAQNL